MKKRIIKWILCILLGFILICFIIVVLFFIEDRKMSVPNEIEKVCFIEEKEFMGRKVYIISPKSDSARSNNVILYFHGGAYVAEATKNHWDFIESLVDDTGSTVIFPDYPLTPKYNYKDVFQTVIPLYKEVIEKNGDDNLILMGDSAGGGLALALEEKISEESLPLPRKTILISPWLDVRLNNAKIEEVQKNDKELNREKLQMAGFFYAGGDGRDNYLVSPIEGNMAKLKNIVIMTGTDDILNPDVYSLQEKAKQNGVDIQVKEYEAASHIWIIDKNSSEELVNRGYMDLIELIKNRL